MKKNFASVVTPKSSQEWKKKTEKSEKNLEQLVPRRSTRSPYPLRFVTSLGCLVNRGKI